MKRCLRLSDSTMDNDGQSLSLKEARDRGKLAEFIKEREAEQADPKAFNQTLKAMARTSKAAPKASSRRSRDD